MGNTMLRIAGHLTLAGLISEVEECARGLDRPKVYFGFGGFFPTDIASWRGAYDELAIDYVVNSRKPNGIKEAPTVEDFLRMCRDAIGETYYGYKGGEYLMDGHTRVWVDKWGDATCTTVLLVETNGLDVYLQTGYREY